MALGCAMAADRPTSDPSPADLFKALEDQQARLAEQFAQFSVPKINFPPPEWVETTKRLNAMFQVQAAQHQRMVERFKPVTDEITRIQARLDRLENAGWLVHRSTPMALLTGDQPAEEVDARLTDHYRSHWPEVRAQIEAQYDVWDLDAESRASIGEALTAHGVGLYRACSRTLFPELERITRQRLQGDALTPPNTSQKSLREAMGRLTLHDVEPGGLPAWVLFGKLSDHVYAHVSNPTVLTEVASDPVPNRHAVLHGLGSYATQRSSFNAIAMADFIIQVVTALVPKRPAG